VLGKAIRNTAAAQVMLQRVATSGWARGHMVTIITKYAIPLRVILVNTLIVASEK
jgi:hypothetical protein